MSEPKDVYGQFMKGSIEESAFATFTQGAAIETGASVNRIQGQNLAIELHSVLAVLSDPEDLPATGAQEAVYFWISTRSGLTTSPSISDEHIVYAACYSIRAGVGVYLPLIADKNKYYPSFHEYKYPILISHKKLYPYIISTNSSAAANVKFCLSYTYVLVDGELAIEALEAFR